MDTIPSDLLAALKNRSARLTDEINHSDRKVEVKARQYCKESLKYTTNLFNSDQISTNKELTGFVENLVRTLENKSDIHKEKTLVFVSGVSVVNALTTGEGVIVCNAGLISRLSNEDQMAFVLAHELSHYYLGHVKSSFLTCAKIETSKDFKNDIQSTKYGNFNRYSRMGSLMRNVRISLSRHSREHEFEADSLAVVQMIKSGYDGSESIKVLGILDSADLSLDRETINLRTHFDFKDYPFKKEWANYSKNEMYHAPRLKDDSDSTKTHPNCRQRIAAVSRVIDKTNKGVFTNVPRPLSYLAKISQFEQIESEFHLKHFGRSLFFALMQLNEYPDNAYLHAMIGRNLYEIYLSQKNHTFSRVVELPSNQFDENYDRIITFIHQLRISEVEGLAYHYMISRAPAYLEDENFLFSLWKVSQLPSSKLDSESIKTDYQNKFPTGVFIKQFK